MASKTKKTDPSPAQFHPASVGGIPRHARTMRAMSFYAQPPDADDPNVIWDFGWISPDLRTSEESRIEEKARASFVPFVLQGKNRYGDDRKALLYECWKHHDAVAQMKFGKVYPGNHQLTGSCVGAGGGNYLYSLSCVEMIRLGEPELAVVPFWPLPYGRSRFYLGDRGPGEGSTGTTFGKALVEDGVVPADASGLPSYTADDGLVWGRNVELSWSDGDASQTMNLLPESRKHLVKSVAQLKNADEAREAIVAGFPFGFCGDWGGLMECPVVEGVLLNRHAGSWNHQESCHGWMDHPKLGELFYILNQWGLKTHGICPTGAPPGGFWIVKKDMEYQCRNGECIVPSQFNGFPAPDRPIPWIY